MRIGSLFSGIGGLELGLEWAGLGETVWQVEKDEKLRNCLATHWPRAEQFGAIENVLVHQLGPVDLICGGFPCQDVSGAGRKTGMSGARSGLWSEMARIVKALRPRWVVVENVATGAPRWVDHVRQSLDRLEYGSLPIPISVADCGGRHERTRVFIIANTEKQGKRRLATMQRETLPQPEGHSGWAHEPDVARVVYGLSGRVDRERALGNSVVPQCAQVVGEVIKLMDANIE